MEEKPPSKVELIIAGLGGMGVLVAGRLLASAALVSHEHVSWMPAYGEAMRGGLSECTVILSHDAIASPILDVSEAVLMLDSSQLKAFEQRVRPGGIMIVEKAGLKEKPAREDIRVVTVSGMEVAMGLGSLQVTNLVMLGAYMGLVKPISPQLIEDELQRKYGERGLERNAKAFRVGMEVGRALAAA
jgi:2-oxoglutarate ferredoxin oxidoreductase subunit gamma